MLYLTGQMLCEYNEMVEEKDTKREQAGDGVRMCKHIKLMGSSYCHQHKCHYIDENTYCTNMCYGHTMYCSEHQDVESPNDSEICQECYTVIQYGSQYCFEHTCQHPTCVGYKKSKHDVLYCDDHECSISRCYNLREKGHTVCAEHMCHWDGCPNQLEYMSDNYCSEHECKSCENKVVINEKYCKHHLCTYIGCHEGGREYDYPCEQHKCKYEKCQSTRWNDSDYCKNHTCQNLTHVCLLPVRKVTGYCGCCGSFCQVHACDVESCENRKKDGANYCDTHLCHEEGCLNGVIFRSGYCTEHSCRYGTTHWRCLNRSNSLCSEHKCKKCDSPVMGGLGVCCDIHTCIHDMGAYRCQKEVDGSTQLCTDHKCGGCGKGKKTWEPACGPNCTDETYAFMYSIVPKDSGDLCKIIDGRITIYPMWKENPKLTMIKVGGHDVYVSEYHKLCVHNGCQMIVGYTDRCGLHSEDVIQHPESDKN